MIPKSGNGFRKRSCSSNKLERDDDSKKSHPALAACRTQVSVFVCADNSIATGGFMVIVPEGSMLFERAFPCQMEWHTRIAAPSGGRPGAHALPVSDHRDEGPI